jgi:hypothetical protein
MIRENKFRSDLYYRLHVFPIRIPPLRERPEDIPLLVRHYVQQFSRRLGKNIDVIPPETMDVLVGYLWPGNVFRTPTLDANRTEPREHTISCSVEQRWHRLGRDLGWRPVCAGPFAYQAPVAGTNIASWTATIPLPHSSGSTKFRLLLEEHEWLSADGSKDNTGGVPPTRKRRTTYLHYVEL